jgi:hypothetical protein
VPREKVGNEEGKTAAATAALTTVTTFYLP